MSERCKDIEHLHLKEHIRHYGRTQFRFEWGTVTHPGIWACGGGNRNLPPVLVGASLMSPPKEQTEAWWAYIGPVPAFDNTGVSTCPGCGKLILGDVEDKS